MRKLFELKENYDGQGKVAPLKEAIAQSVGPGMKIHMNTGAYASAALREITRQYWGKDPGFTFISSGVTSPCQISFACSGLVRKIVSTNHSYIYPRSRPIPLLQDMQEKGKINVEDWSLYSLEQRLMAGALGVGFMPTRSLMDSSLCKENSHAFKVISDPFGERADMGVVKALNPDVSIIHGCVADREGNTILAPPYFTSIWGPRASRGGVIVTVERIVSSEFIRRHNSLVKLPGFLVRFVCEVPLGAHPQGLASETVGISGGYGDDYEFMGEFVDTSRNFEDLEQWIKEWILGCPNHDDYLQKLGPERILALKGKSDPDAWRSQFLEPDSKEEKRAKFNAVEMMIVAAAREIEGLVMGKGYHTILAGIGSPGLAAWLAFYMMKKMGRRVSLLTGFGQVGYAPRP
ncbi:MAG: hypothetical protein JRJ29_22710, partial [Deltaproteobacteria bacterium]|nr:hypothetical protein [Deltaproteobacteria bacterium]